ncbi:hypothetical protein DPMN_181975 [Dreissena polymorpha]|uniref:C1q domain-containing protein n=1 Tax=Dreissena polymorpha TaxID=45954 RepID=A0A9D4I4X3_DREPO|nr:hypothetical protein DPMN_181975 [Dreissena polymorpha]
MSYCLFDGGEHGFICVLIIEFLLNNTLFSYLLYPVKNAKAGTTPNILFKARRVRNETPTDGQVIVFEDVLYNHGSGYDSSSGVFTAPVGGTYLFTARLLSQSSGKVIFEINVNGSMNSNGALYDHKGYSYASADSVVRLLPRERVFIKSLDSNMIANSGLHTPLTSKSNEFTGVLLHM